MATKAQLLGLVSDVEWQLIKYKSKRTGFFNGPFRLNADGCSARVLAIALPPIFFSRFYSVEVTFGMMN